MKRTIAIILLSLAIISMGKIIYNLNNEKIRWKNNYEAEHTARDQEKQLTKKELGIYYGKIIDKLQEKLDVKPKFIERIIQGEVMYRDTGSTRIINSGANPIKIYPDSLNFKIKRPCYDLSILVYKGIAFDNIIMHDSISAILYKKRPYKFLFIEYGRWEHKAAIFSSCSDTVYKSFENIKVIKR